MSLASWYGVEEPPRAEKRQLPPIGAERLIAAWLDGLSPLTIDHYRSDMQQFARWLGLSSAEEGAKHIVGLSNGEANVLVGMEWRAAQLKKGFAPSSINRRLAAVRSFTRAARRVGLIAWVLEFDRLPVMTYRDTSGPSVDGYERMMAALNTRTDAKGARDRAILKLMFQRALRRNEVRMLDFEDVNLEAGTIDVMGKGRRGQKERLTVAPATVAALREWICIRGAWAGPLFPNGRGPDGAGRLTGQGLYRLVRKLGELVGVRARPHGGRHFAITSSLDLGADLRAVQAFARHADPKTTIRYSDNRSDFGGAVACMVAGDPKPTKKRKKAELALTTRFTSPLHALGLKRGEANPNSKLTADKVREIRRRHAEGESAYALAREFKVAELTVQFAVKRKTWRHVV